MKRIVLLLFVVAFPVLVNFKAEATTRDSLLSDFDTFIALLEDTHPDPYTNFGGRAFFKEKADEFRNKLMADSACSVDRLCGIAQEFASMLQDGHTFINQPQSAAAATSADSLLVIKFMYGDGSLIVNAISESDSILIGSRLEAINGVPAEEIAARAAALYPCENNAGRYACLTGYFRSPDFYHKLARTPGGPLVFTLTTPAGKKVDYRPAIIHASEFSQTDKARPVKRGEFPSAQMEWGIVDSTMFFCLRSVMARENFEYQYNHGWDYFDQLKYHYYSIGEEMPADTLEAIRSLPSMSETFMEMLGSMKNGNISDLVIDLRGNGGGWTPVVLPTLYMMYGDDFLTVDMSYKLYRRISDLYLKKINTTIADFNASNGSNLKTGDYTVYADTPDSRSLQQRRNDFLRTAFCTDEVRERLLALGGAPVYKPERVYVVTDEGTFSAAFHYAFYLKKMGAVIAGEPSSQAPNCYMEVTPFVLPMTGLTGSISNSMQVFLPADDPCAKEFTPEIRLGYEDYRRYDFDTNSILHRLLGH